MTNQEIFDKVSTHLLKQGVKSLISYDEGTKTYCAYRGDNGTQCAAGCLIPDELYSKSFELKPFNNYLILESLKSLNLSSDNIALIQQLQNCHDRSDPSDWRTELSKIATKNSLNMEPQCSDSSTKNQ